MKSMTARLLLVCCFAFQVFAPFSPAAHPWTTNAPAPSLTSSLSGFLAASEWAVLDEPEFTSLHLPGLGMSLPLYIELTDPLSGVATRISSGSASTHKSWLRWSGRTDDIRWEIMMRDAPKGGIEITLHLAADKDLPVQVRMGVELLPGDWTWHDGLDRSRAFNATSPALSHPTTDQLLTLVPFGVVSRNNLALVAANDPNEPRMFQVTADPSRSFFGLVYEMGLTQLTRKFPGEATLRVHLWHCILPSDNPRPMRHALASYYQHFENIYLRPSPVMGAWAPFVDSGTLPGRADFGPMVNVLPPGSTLNPLDEQRVALLYSEPWYYWLPIPDDQPRDDATIAILLAKQAAGSAIDAQLAASALHHPARRLDHTPEHLFLNTPWNNGARLTVSVDPDRVPMDPRDSSRAEMEARILDAHPRDAGWRGIFLDSLFGLNHRDYSEESLSSADFPAIMDRSSLQPVYPGIFGALEWMVLLHHHLTNQGQFVIGNGALAYGGTFSACLDGFVEEIVYDDQTASDRLTGERAERSRMIAGSRLVSPGLMADFDDISPTELETYFRKCLRFGFLPGLHSENGYHNMYWKNASWYHRDRPLFKKFMPLLQRLANAGWNPMTGAAALPEHVKIEQFGREPRIFSIQNQSPTHTTGLVDLSMENSVIMLRPLNGWVSWHHAGDISPLPIPLAPGQVDAFIVIPVDEVDDEISRYPEDHDIHANLASLKNEWGIGLEVEIATASPIIRGDETKIDITFKNQSDKPIRIADIAAQGALRRRSSTESSFTIATNGARTATIRLRASDLQDDPLIHLSWTAKSGSTSFTGQRRFHPIYADSPTALSLERQASVSDLLSATNLMRDPRIRIAATGNEPGYKVENIRNGISAGSNQAWTNVAWRSIRRMDEHRVDIQFPEPVEVEQIHIYWGADARQAYPPGSGLIRAITRDGQETILAKYEPPPFESRTLITTPPITVTRIQITQPPLNGPAIAPMIMWINEVEVFGPQVRGHE